MIQLSYTRSPQLISKIDEIDKLRNELLCLPISWKEELYLQWSNAIDRTQHLLQLEDIFIQKKTLENILSYQTQRSLTREETLALNLKKAYDSLYFNWHVQTTPINEESIREILKDIQGFKLDNLGEFAQSLVYIQTNPDHPLIQAALAEISALHSNVSAPYMMIFGSIVRSMFLYKNGYDLNRLVSLSHYYYLNRTNYQAIQAQSIKENNTTHWIEFILEGYKNILEQKIEQIRAHSLGTDPKYAEFQALLTYSERQKKILAFLSKPGIEITNRQVQKLCKVSAITAARDLAKLAAAGEIFAIGKGRSTKYAKV